MALVSRSTIKGSALNGRIWVWVLLSIVLIFELTRLGNDEVSSADSGLAVSLTQTYSDENIYGLTPPKGKAIALPSIRTGDQNTVKAGGLYGGIGDKQHLGGFTDLDHHGVSPAAWKWMVKYVGVHSVLDVGCGRGISTSWFYFHGVDVLCVEGSHDAVERTVLPDKNLVVEHDFSRGPWWPEKTYDAVWCVEFLEHVREQYAMVVAKCKSSECIP
jgi:SAM-dependent methyltransferase